MRRLQLEHFGVAAVLPHQVVVMTLLRNCALCDRYIAEFEPLLNRTWRRLTAPKSLDLHLQQLIGFVLLGILATVVALALWSSRFA
jgi:hypothetical protein